MSKLPDYVGPAAFGLKMGVILPGMSIVDEVFKIIKECHRDNLLDEGDIIAVTESVVARAQNNYVKTSDIAREVREKLNLSPESRVAVVFPIASRNRFAMVLRGIAEAVPRGEVLVQFSFPRDEVGNQIIDPEYAESRQQNGLIEVKDIDRKHLCHPITKVNYTRLYHDVVKKAGAKPHIYLCNDPLRVVSFKPKGVIAADIHTREATCSVIRNKIENCITLDSICSEGPVFSEWGLLGSNMSSGDRVKLAPREGQKIVEELQQLVFRKLGLRVEVLIYGDGAYRDPSSGIYELADPRPAFAVTGGLKSFREGVKLKYIADHYFYEHGKNAAEIEEILAESKSCDLPGDSIEREGTTPRRLEDVLASLADLVSGSADAATPVVLIKGF